jgi:vacuolar-type H+-ATPase subunit H
LVFQASEKKTSNKAVGADFRDLELIKKAEDSSIQEIERSKKQAELKLAKEKQRSSNFERKAIADLKSRLDKQFKVEENKAMAEAKKIKADGEVEAEALKQKVRPRIPQAVDYIVKAIIAD